MTSQSTIREQSTQQTVLLQDTIAEYHDCKHMELEYVNTQKLPVAMSLKKIEKPINIARCIQAHQAKGFSGGDKFMDNGVLECKKIT